jgi:glutamyl-Q tRNA(Asp) synthetase
MYHLVGITPEAATLQQALGHKEPLAVIPYGQAERRQTYDELNSKASDPNVDFVMLGCPHAALEQLQQDGLVYACFCTRSDIAEALAAPHGAASSHYPGLCHALADDPQRRAEQPHSWRLDAERALHRTGLPSWREHGCATFEARLDDFEDVILARKDAPAAYHLACVVDDATSGVTLVVRGADLRPSTPTHRLLQLLLGLREPAYLHHRLVLHEDGRRLAKRDLAPTLAAMRASGVDGEKLADALATGVVPSGFRLGNP